MRTKVILVSLLFLFVGKIFGCPPTYDYIHINQSHGTISFPGSLFQANHYKVWVIDIGEERNIRLNYYKDTQTYDFLQIFKVDSREESVYAYYNSMNYYDNVILDIVDVPYKRGTVTTTVPSGICIVRLGVLNGGNGNYSGLQLDFGPAPEDSTVVTETSSMILGSQYVMENLGIGTDMPVTPLHIKESTPLERSSDSFVPLTRLEGRTMDYTGSTPIFTDEVFYRNGSNLSYMLGTSYGNISSYYVDPQLILSWIKQTPEQKSVTIGSGSMTLLEAKRLAPSPATNPESEVIIGGTYTKDTGYGSKLTFLGASENSTPLFMSRYNQGSGKADLRMNIGSSESNDKRFVIGRTTSNTWYPKFTFTSNGKLGIGVDNPQYPIDVKGVINADTIKVKTLLNDVNDLIITSGNSTTTTAYAPLHVENASGGITQSGFKMFSSFSAEGASSFPNVKVTNNLFVRKFNENYPPDWALHDGITNGMQSNPYSSSQTWWERFPFDSSGKQTWGHGATTYMTLKGGKLGIGIEPIEQLHVNGNVKADIIKASDFIMNSTSAAQTATTYTNTKTGANNGFVTGIDASGNGMIWHQNSSHISFGTNNTERVRILANGNVGIGVEDPTHALDVNGTINAQKVTITPTVPAPDYVFAPDYKLLGLQEVEEHINEHQHLPEVPSAVEIAEKGVDVIDLNFKLLQKIEELTLYVIEQNKRISILEKALEEK